MDNKSASACRTTGTLTGDLEAARRKAKLSAKQSVNDFVHWIFAMMFIIPVILISLNLLLGDDLRYWPTAVPVSYAPVTGVILLAACVLFIWPTLKRHFGVKGNRSGKTPG